jgi:predicted O-methyltransferase YrrM
MNNRITTWFLNYYDSSICKNLDLHTFTMLGELQHLTDLIDSLEKKEKITALEIGSWKGISAAFIATNLKKYPDSKLICVDTWEVPKEDTGCYIPWVKEGKPDLLKIFIKNISLLGLSNMVDYKIGLSEKIVPNLKEKFDFIFIDGCHEYEYIKRDIEVSRTKLNEKGIISGHDYSNNAPGVIKAVNENFSNIKIYQNVWSWQS